MKTAMMPLIAVALISGCNSSNEQSWPSSAGLLADQPLKGDRTAKALECIRSTGILKGKRFAVGPFRNGTGKANGVSDGATGSFLPTGDNLAVFAVEALSRAGAVVFDYANLDVTRNIATIGGPMAIKFLHKQQNANMPNYAVSVFATALDFSGASRTDLRIAGLGPKALSRNATSYYAAHVTIPGSQLSVARGYSLYRSTYREVGIGVGRFVGGGTGTLVTGEISTARQQPLQRPAADGVMLSIAFALVGFSGAGSCRIHLMDTAVKPGSVRVENK